MLWFREGEDTETEGLSSFSLPPPLSHTATLNFPGDTNDLLSVYFRSRLWFQTSLLVLLCISFLPETFLFKKNY